MKKSLLLLSILTFAGCDSKTSPAAPKFTPPVEIGDGKVLMFEAQSDEDFHDRLNDYFAFHKEYRLDTIKYMNNWKYIVIVDPTNQSAPLPTTVPSDLGSQNAQGEIKY